MFLCFYLFISKPVMSESTAAEVNLSVCVSGASVTVNELTYIKL